MHPNQNLSCLAFAGVLASVNLATAASLAHHWDFSNGADTVGGATASLQGGASFSGGSLQLPGGGVFRDYASVNVASTLNASPSLTVESWFTLDTLTTWSKVWMFGNDNPGGQPGLSYINFTPRTGLAGNIPKSDFDPVGAGEFNTTLGSNPAALGANTQYHVVTIFDAAANTQSFYINGVLADTGSMGGFNITQLNPNTMRFGAGFFYGDADIDGSINEISIWRGALSPQEVAAEYAVGPDRVAVGTPDAGSTLLMTLLGLGGLSMAKRWRR